MGAHERNAPPPAVVYAAKSTPDERDSIPEQLDDARAAAERAGQHVEAEYKDENASAWKGNRGEDLVRAMEHTERLAREHGRCDLWVQDSDRLARGDGKQARHLVELALWALKFEGGTIRLRSVDDDATFRDLSSVASRGDRNNADSERKSRAVTRGLARRARAGKPVGALPDGYDAVPVIVDGVGCSQRVVNDERMGAVYHPIMDAVEAGSTPGEVARKLNTDGLRTRRGKPWEARSVRRIVRNEDYCGGTGYPPVIERERWERINAELERMDPAAVQARKGGRPSQSQKRMLSGGLAFCLRCGGTLYVRHYAKLGGYGYRCRRVMQNSGLCDAPPISCEMAEGAVLRHLESIIGQQLAQWVLAQSEHRDGELEALRAALAREREKLRGLERRVQRLREQHLRLLEDSDETLADAALRAVMPAEQAASAQAVTVGDAEARVAEWEAAPSHDAALDYYSEIVGVVRGELKQARGVDELNAALRKTMQGVYLDINNGCFRADVRLRAGERVFQQYTTENYRGPWQAFALAPPPSQTEPQSFVYVHPKWRPISW
ncbi:recombinase family protein [Solirubrobacter soli]|uniref:recombinase family protein n=1 Tax=Solirubrobacter soli TaxID=363832 RepID=UPI0004087B70|nr:recombinase family protein [Solirubrobacter soli]